MCVSQHKKNKSWYCFWVTFLTFKKISLCFFPSEFTINHDYYVILLQTWEFWDKLFMVISNYISPQTHHIYSDPILDICKVFSYSVCCALLMVRIAGGKKRTFRIKRYLNKLCLNIGQKFIPIRLQFLVLPPLKLFFLYSQPWYSFRSVGILSSE